MTCEGLKWYSLPQCTDKYKKITNYILIAENQSEVSGLEITIQIWVSVRKPASEFDFCGYLSVSCQKTQVDWLRRRIFPYSILVFIPIHPT